MLGKIVSLFRHVSIDLIRFGGGSHGARPGQRGGFHIELLTIDWHRYPSKEQMKKSTIGMPGGMWTLLWITYNWIKGYNSEWKVILFNRTVVKTRDRFDFLTPDGIETFDASGPDMRKAIEYCDSQIIGRSLTFGTGKDCPKDP